MRVYGLLIGLVLTLGVSSAAAQTSPSFGVKAGVNFANLDFDADDVNLSFDRRTALVAGGFVLWPVRDTFGLQVEGLFTQKGAKIEDDGIEGSIKLDFFEVPVLARFSVPSSTRTSFHLFAGPSFGFRLRARSEAESEGESEDLDISDDVAGFDLGLVVGAGVEFGRIIVDGRYTHGLTNLNTSPDDQDDVKIKSRVFSIMAGFRW